MLVCYFEWAGLDPSSVVSARLNKKTVLWTIPRPFMKFYLLDMSGSFPESVLWRKLMKVVTCMGVIRTAPGPLYRVVEQPHVPVLPRCKCGLRVTDCIVTPGEFWPQLYKPVFLGLLWALPPLIPTCLQ